MKKLFILATISAFLSVFVGCNSNSSTDNTGTSTETTATDGTQKDATATENPSYDPDRGTGKFTKVDIGDKLDATMAASGEKIFTVKCSSCHKLTDEKLVGPGWKGVTTRHKPEWIMNFITNTDEMISKDPAAQAQLAICLVRMPNQSLSDDDARHLLEFQRKNDGIK